MHKDLVVKTKTLSGVSDLTLFAPIKQGLVPSLESVTYKTRVKMLLRTLSGSRASSQEYSLIRPFSDSVERVGAIHSVRVVIREPEDILMLAATFDGAWETYIRVLWQKVGTLLDVIFCNTVDYVASYNHSCDEWAAWARRVQVETEFFYGMPGLTVPDIEYLRRQDALLRDQCPGAGSDAASAALAVPSPEFTAWKNATGLPPSSTTPATAIAPPEFKNIVETCRQGLQGLSQIYRLTDLYVPGTDDGGYLHRAARDLLLEFSEIDTRTYLDPKNPNRIRFARQLAWFERPSGQRPQPSGAAQAYAKSDVQAGIVSEYSGTTHGCLMLIALDDAAAWAAFLARMHALVTRDDSGTAEGQVFTNVAFTIDGLRALGLPEDELARFPHEFREGMEARASVLGDLRNNHPRRWRLPRRNWDAPPAAAGSEIELCAVHAMVQLRVRSASTERDVALPAHPLHAQLHAVLGPKGSGARLLSVQSMSRHFSDPAKTQAREHFGFVDGISQPTVDMPPGTVYPNRVPLGDLLLGYDTEADISTMPPNDLRRNGSFLVVRKLRQDVAALEHVLTSAQPAGATRDELLKKMMGRELGGTPLIASPTDNDFDYAGDPAGAACPFHAHVRRANPRTQKTLHVPPGGVAPPGGRMPRIARRGMSYGPRYDLKNPANPVNSEERGIVFMAYNASIAEQFETIQRWIAGGNSGGGNSTGASSDESDPFLGVPTPGRARTFRYADGATTRRITLNSLADATPLVQLEWGAYLFAPSLTALKTMQRVAAAAARPAPAWSVSQGLALVEQLEAADRRLGAAAASLWKSALEDPEERRLFRSAAIWAAIREHRGGVLRTSFGVLVAAHERVMEVFSNTSGHYSVSGYLDRMQRSFGEIFLGLDDDPAAPRACPYHRESNLTNTAIQRITEAEAYELARRFADQKLDMLIFDSKAIATKIGAPGWELNLDIKELCDHVLACLCEEWFGPLGAGDHLAPGGARWDWEETDPPLYPGHFTAPSRYMFQPAPGECPVKYGQWYGQALLKAMRAFVADPKTEPEIRHGGKPARIGAAIFEAGDKLFGKGSPQALEQRERWIASTMIGVMVGFLPSVDGNLRASLNEWLKDGTFWRLRGEVRGMAGADPKHGEKTRELLRPALEQSMQLRPAPESVWRIATTHHRLGPVDIEAGDRVVLAIVSATQQSLADGVANVLPVFGGARDGSATQPAHACPGLASGMGVLLGMIAALLARPESLRPSPAALAVTLTGPLAIPAPAPASALATP